MQRGWRLWRGKGSEACRRCLKSGDVEYGKIRGHNQIIVCSSDVRSIIKVSRKEHPCMNELLCGHEQGRHCGS